MLMNYPFTKYGQFLAFLATVILKKDVVRADAEAGSGIITC
jgi:hypothetical protein